MIETLATLQQQATQEQIIIVTIGTMAIIITVGIWARLTINTIESYWINR